MWAAPERFGHFGPSRLATSYQGPRQSAAVLARLFLGLRGVNVLRAWAGLIDMTPEGAGIIGESEDPPGSYLDCGWGGEGYLVSVGTSPLIAEYPDTGRLARRLAPFRARRLFP